MIDKKLYIDVLKDVATVFRDMCKEYGLSIKNCIEFVNTLIGVEIYFTSMLASKFFERFANKIQNLCDKYKDDSARWDICIYIYNIVTTISIILEHTSHIQFDEKGLNDIVDIYLDREIKRFSELRGENI